MWASLIEQNKYGVRRTPVMLIKSYLYNRQKCVNIGGHQSSFSSTLCGAPQGSILEPLLFIVYINDIVNIDDQTQYIIHADDTCLSRTGDVADIFIRMANLVLNIFFVWSEVNGLKINTLKSKAILFRTVNTLIIISCPLKTRSDGN